MPLCESIPVRKYRINAPEKVTKEADANPKIFKLFK